MTRTTVFDCVCGHTEAYVYGENRKITDVEVIVPARVEFKVEKPIRIVEV